MAFAGDRVGQNPREDLLTPLSRPKVDIPLHGDRPSTIITTRHTRFEVLMVVMELPRMV